MADSRDKTMMDPPDPRLVASGASLNGLPDELIVHIIEIIATYGYARWQQIPSMASYTLGSLFATNRRLNYLVTPMLYARAHPLSAGDVWEFLRTIVSKPQLAKYIKKIEWPAGIPDGHMPFIYKDFQAGDQWVAYDSAARKELASMIYEQSTSCKHSPQYMHRIASSCNAARADPNGAVFLAAAVLYAPQLEYINAVWTSEQNIGLTWVDSIAHAPTHAFEHLHSIKLDIQSSGDDWDKGGAAVDLNVLLLLPSLRKLDVSHLYKTLYHGNSWPALRVGASNVQALILRQSYVQAEVLAHAVKACRQLETFVYHHNRDKVVIWYVCLIDMAVLLSHHPPASDVAGPKAGNWSIKMRRKVRP
jgi:hypothetical protein